VTRQVVAGLFRVKAHSGQSFGLCKENSCTCESLGYQYEWKNY
jgi:hypothetical protein